MQIQDAKCFETNTTYDVITLAYNLRPLEKKICCYCHKKCSFF